MDSPAAARCTLGSSYSYSKDTDFLTIPISSYRSLLLYRSSTRLYGDHIPHTSPYLTVQKNFFTIDDEGLYDEP